MNSIVRSIAVCLLSFATMFTYGCKDSDIREVTYVTELEEVVEESTTCLEKYSYKLKGSINKHSTVETIEETTEELLKETEETSTEEKVYYSEDEYSAVILAKTMYGEARGVYSVTEQACIAWTILNRVDYYGGSVYEVATSPNQFAYSYSFATIDDYGRDLVALSRDILGRWEAEKQGVENVGRVLPSDYMWYAGDGYHNYFRNSYEGGPDWDYSLPSPYES